MKNIFDIFVASISTWQTFSMVSLSSKDVRKVLSSAKNHCGLLTDFKKTRKSRRVKPTPARIVDRTDPLGFKNYKIPKKPAQPKKLVPVETVQSSPKG